MSKHTNWFSKKPSVAFALSMLVVSILPLLCGWVFYASSSAQAHKQQENLVEQSLKLTMHQFDTDLTSVINMTLNLRKTVGKMPMPDEEDFTPDHRMLLYETRMVLRDARNLATSMVKDIYFLRPDADYAVSPAAVISRKILYERYWKPYGISEKDFSLLHLRHETGSILSINQARPVFLLTVSRDMKTNLPTRQLVVVLAENYFANLFTGFDLPDIAYSLYTDDGALIYQSKNKPAEDTVTFTLPSNAGTYVLNAYVPNAYFYNHADMLRVLYISMLVATLIISAVLIFSLARRNAMPINKLISYIRENYQIQNDEENAAGLNLIQSSVEQMLQEHENHKQQLQQYQEREEMHILGNAFLGLNKELPPTGDDTSPYVVVCFQLSDDHDAEQLKNALSHSFPAGYISRCVFLSGDLMLLLRRHTGDMDEDSVNILLENTLQALDDMGLSNLRCAVSLVHHQSDELEMAYREASMAFDSLFNQSDLPILRFDTIRYSPEYFLRDFHHLDKQLTFATQMGEQEYEMALNTLTSLFPGEFLDDNTSTLSQLHLSSLKFQFLHDLNSISAPLADADELNRTNARDIISCKTHRELMALMQKIIGEIDSMPKVQGEEHDMQIDEIKTYIRNNSWDKQLSVSSVADAFHLSSNALSKLFSRKANMGVLQYIHKIRIENACHLLLSDENTNIAAIATQVGYASTLTFNRAFKARYNMTPSEYRRIHKQAGEH
ncbi:MAG: helix-turn-helix transcriptional regulator [Clostridiales bacterium]|nr:helix-turn-helix transcriptional regulator [Clostridiales bacterium]